MLRLGVVSFLNAKPLVEGLADRRDVEITYDVPANLAERLDRDEVDVALVPIIDVIRSRGELAVVSDACIACDGETMTVRVFSQVPPNRIRRLHMDLDSHTSVALAMVLWRELFDTALEPVAFDARSGVPDTSEAVLLIGDKVVDRRRGKWAYEIDLGGAWKQQTGLPFVFAVWAARGGESRGGKHSIDRVSLFGLLNSARDLGLQAMERIAAEQGPALGWPVALARRYLIDCLRYKIDGRFVEGAERYARMAGEIGLAPRDAAIVWPEELGVAAGQGGQ